MLLTIGDVLYAALARGREGVPWAMLLFLKSLLSPRVLRCSHQIIPIYVIELSINNNEKFEYPTFLLPAGADTENLLIRRWK